MIIKFLYQMNKNNKRIITGLVENDDIAPYNPLDEYPMVLEDENKLEEGQRVVSNFGKQYYTVSSEDSMKYLNLNDYMLKVRLNMTDNAAFASTLSKDMINAILESTAYFTSEDDFEYIDSGLTLLEDKEYKDFYDGWFRHVEDDVYVQILKYKAPLYVGKENGQYILTEDFSKAFRVSKKECRNLIIANGYVDRDFKKKDVAFSHYNVFVGKNSFGFGGENSFVVSYENDVLTFKKGFTPTNEYKLTNDKERNSKLRDILYTLKKGPTGSKALLTINGLYVSQENDNYTLVSDASKATSLDVHDIDILKHSYRLFLTDVAAESIVGSGYYLLINDDKYELSTEIKQAAKSKIITKQLFDDYVLALSNEDNEKCIIKTEKGYVTFKDNGHLSFELSYGPTAFLATKLSLKLAQVLEGLLGQKVFKYELKSTNPVSLYNISYSNKAYSPTDALAIFNSELDKETIRFSRFVDFNDLRTESDKGSYEYLRRFYVKSIFDAKSYFKMLLKNEDVKNILLVNPMASADLIGLSEALDELNRTVNVTINENVRWGHYPLCVISDKLSINGGSRLSLDSYTKDMLDEFDAIYFGKTYKDTNNSLKKVLKNLMESNKTIYIGHTALSEDFVLNDSIYSLVKATRKTINTPDLSNINLDNQIVLPTSTYTMHLKISKGKLFDLFKK